MRVVNVPTAAAVLLKLAVALITKRPATGAVKALAVTWKAVFTVNAWTRPLPPASTTIGFVFVAIAHIFLSGFTAD
jgi:hypothetical protein